MKIALYIEDGREQIVLTPDSKTEADILRKLHDGDRSISIKSGSFYNCQGGWTRWKTGVSPFQSQLGGLAPREDDESTIIVMDRKEETKPLRVVGGADEAGTK